jgi:polysaccharide export outer membrane protein
MKSICTFFPASIFLLFVSCSTPKNINYISIPPTDSSHVVIHQSFEVPIQVGDQLAITVSALNALSAMPYNLPGGMVSSAGSGMGSSGNSMSGGAGGGGGRGITVEQDGNILYPQLGAIKVEGLTRSQLRDLLVARLKTYLTDPIVTVDLINFRITVLGEVTNQGTRPVPDGRINILEAVAQSGGVTQYGQRHSVMVIREIKGRRQFGNVNLLSNSIFSSPYYRLQQNDIVYVPAVENKPTVDQETKSRNLGVVASVVGLVSTLAFLIFNIVR